LKVVQIRVEEHGDGQADLIALIRNLGSVAATNVPVVFRADNRNIATNVMGGILPGMEAEISLTVWEQITFTNVPATLEVVVDPRNTILESNKENNAAGSQHFLSTDADKDGMPDAWERFYFLDTGHDGYADSDGDGASDLSEYLTGTNPLAPSSVLSSSIMQRDEQGNLIVSWAAQPGKTYQVQYRDDLRRPGWTNLGMPITATSATGSAIDRPPASITNRYYRVMVVNVGIP
jgi:hypothetical protein